MANVTITVDEDVLRRARIRALQRRESVNSYLARALERYAGEVDPAAIFSRIGEVADQSGTGSAGAGRTWTRDDLHRG